jgi:hypothetical protein
VTDQFELRQVQAAEGLYVHVRDLVEWMRTRSAELAERAGRSTNHTTREVYQYAARQFADDADRLDLSAIGCVTAEPWPWQAKPNPDA